MSEVERERLTEHLRMVSKKLRLADEAMRESELALREERRRTAHLVINLLLTNLTNRADHRYPERSYGPGQPQNPILARLTNLELTYPTTLNYQAKTSCVIC